MSIQAAPGQILAQHDYDPVSDAVVSWRLDPGASVGQSFSLRESRLAGIRIKLQRWGQPHGLRYKLGRSLGGDELGSGPINESHISPWFEHWQEVRLPHAVVTNGQTHLFLQLLLPRQSPGSYEIYGTASESIQRPEFHSRFDYIDPWGTTSGKTPVFENAENIDYGVSTLGYEGGEAFDSGGRQIRGLDLAFQALGDHPVSREREERFAFIESITGPLHTANLRLQGEQPKPGEIAIDANWRIASAERSPVVETAIQEFQDFLSTAMQVPRQRAGVNLISVATGCSTAPQKSEGFYVNISPGSIQVCGYDDRGAMQGLHFLENSMRMRRAPFLLIGRERRTPLHSPRITSAPFYSKTELETPVDQYTDGLLGRISRGGFNAIWVWGDLDQVAHSDIFPELDHGVAKRQARLTDLAKRAARYGIDLYLYLGNRPLPEQFFQTHPDVRGSALLAYGGVNVLCTTVPKVRDHFRSATYNLMSSVPGIKGIVFIGGGEGFLHCYSRKNTCPRCLRRSPQETIAEFSTALLQGIREGNPKASVALSLYSASNGWSRDNTTQSRLIERLPAGLTLMTEFAKEGEISFGGITIPAYDYPISIVGPSDRFVAQSTLARAQGLGLWVKTEHAIALEFIQTPYIPAFFQWSGRFERIRASEGISAEFANWIHYGFMPSRATDLYYWNIWDKAPEASDLLTRIARRDFGDVARDYAVRAWKSFSEAIKKYPFSGGMAMGPVQAGPSHPLFFDPAYRPVHHAGRQFTNNLNWTRPWGPQLAILQLDKMEKLWKVGVDELQKADKVATPEFHLEIRRELGISAALLACIRSARNVARFYVLRDELKNAQDPIKARKLLNSMVGVAEAELQNARDALPFVAADSRIGYSNSGKNEQTGVPRGGIYSPSSIEKKIGQVQRMLRDDIPAYRRAHNLE